MIILISIALALIFGGGGASTVLTYVQGHSPKEVRKVIKKEVADAKRQDAALKVVKDWGQADKRQDKVVAKTRKALLKLVTQDDAKLADTVPFTALIDATIQESDRNFLDMRFALKAQMTKAEWDAAVVRLNK